MPLAARLLLLAALVASFAVALPATASAGSGVTMRQAKTFAREIAFRTQRELNYDRNTVRCFRRGPNDIRCRLRYFDRGRQVCSVQDRFWNRDGYTRSRFVPGTATGNGRC